MFDYKAAMNRVRIELLDFVNSYEEELAKRADLRIVRPTSLKKCSPQELVDQQKINHLYFNQHLIKDGKGLEKFLMLYSLCTDGFWQATEHLTKLKDSISREDAELYSTLAIEIAKRSESRIGHAWIVNEYEKGTIKDFVSDELLEEAVNRGFWEMASKYFTGDLHEMNFPKDYYESIMTHLDLLDFSRFPKFKKMLKEKEYFDFSKIDSTIDMTPQEKLDSLTIYYLRWLNMDYLDCFEKAREKLSLEDAAYLARPIIEEILFKARDYYKEGKLIAYSKADEGIIKSIDKAINNLDDYLKEEFAPYLAFLGGKEITDLFEEIVVNELREYSLDDEDALDLDRPRIIGGRMGAGLVKALRPYINVSDEVFMHEWCPGFELITNDGLRRLANSSAIIQFILPERVAELKSDMLNLIDSSFQNFDKLKEEIIPELRVIQYGIRSHWIDESEGRNRIEAGLKTYLIRKSRPEGKQVKDLVEGLKSKYIDKRLYIQVLHQVIKDYAKSDMHSEAIKLRDWLRDHNWLDESKLPRLDAREDEIIKKNVKIKIIHSKRPWEKEPHPNTTLEDFF